jgi:hypothetical protein
MIGIAVMFAAKQREALMIYERTKRKRRSLTQCPASPAEHRQRLERRKSSGEEEQHSPHIDGGTNAPLYDILELLVIYIIVIIIFIFII